MTSHGMLTPRTTDLGKQFFVARGRVSCIPRDTSAARIPCFACGREANENQTRSMQASSSVQSLKSTFRAGSSRCMTANRSPTDLQSPLANGARLRVPDLASILGDSTVARKFSRTSHIQDGPTRPFLGVGVEFDEPVISIQIRCEIGQMHVGWPCSRVFFGPSSIRLIRPTRPSSPGSGSEPRRANGD